jgi:hypothetical protein
VTILYTGQNLKNTSPMTLAGVGLMIQFSTQDVGGFTLGGAGNHLSEEKVSRAADAQYKGAELFAKAADLHGDTDQLRVCYDAIVLNLHNVSHP